VKGWAVTVMMGMCINGWLTEADAMQETGVADRCRHCERCCAQTRSCCARFSSCTYTKSWHGRRCHRHNIEPSLNATTSKGWYQLLQAWLI
jgi:hypothetical protein